MADKKRQQFTFEDLQQWVEEGLISPTQAVAVRQYVADKGAVDDRTGGVERRTGLNLVSIAYYFGAFMILLAYTIFMGLQWQTLGLIGQFAVTSITLAVLFGTGAWLRRVGFVTVSNQSALGCGDERVRCLYKSDDNPWGGRNDVCLERRMA